MNKFTRCLAIIIFIFFEVYAGIRLLTSPADFSNSAIVVYGIVMLLTGAVMLFFSLSMKEQFPLSYKVGLGLGILNILLGLLCVILSDKIVSIFPVFAVAFGVITFFTGIDKLGNYFIIKAKGLPHHWIWMVGAVLTIILGVVIMLNPFTSLDVAFTYAGYFLIISGVVDLFTFIFSFFF